MYREVISMEEIEFTLSGKHYRLSRAGIEEAVEFDMPKAIEKYFVELSGRRWPPKQIISTALKLQPVGFTTMAAKGILERLGIPVLDVTEAVGRPATESERLFESYLNASGLTEFEFQPHIQGASARPDFRLHVSDTGMVFFEVKEFQPTNDDFRPGGGYFDPYEPIRRKIQDAMPQFKDLKSECCAVVLFNVGRPLVHLGWRFVYGAMLGNLSFRFPVRLAPGPPIETPLEPVFGPGGEMIREKNGKPFEPQKTRISAIIVLERLAIGKRRYEVEVKRKEMEMGRDMTIEEYLGFERNQRGTEGDFSLAQPRTVVCENPYAARPLPKELFRGPYDERYGQIDESVGRKYAGEQIAKLEAEQASVGLRVGSVPD
jgi:hypothetical protein